MQFCIAACIHAQAPVTVDHSHLESVGLQGLGKSIVDVLVLMGSPGTQAFTLMEGSCTSIADLGFMLHSSYLLESLLLKALIREPEPDLQEVLPYFGRHVYRPLVNRAAAFAHEWMESCEPESWGTEYCTVFLDLSGQYPCPHCAAFKHSMTAYYEALMRLC